MLPRHLLVMLILALTATHGFAETPATDTTLVPALETEAAKAERELTNRVVEARKSVEAEAEQRRVVEESTATLEKVRLGGDDEAIRMAEHTLEEAKKSLDRLIENTATAQKLQLQAKEKLDIARRNEDLTSKKVELPLTDVSKTPFDDVLKKKSRVIYANEEAELAQKKTDTLRDQIDTLVARQRVLRQGQDELFDLLNGETAPSGAERSRILAERQKMVEEGRRVGDELQQLREEFLLAEATQHIKENTAQEELASYAQWKSNLIWTGTLFVVAFSLVLGARLLVASRVKQPQRRYYLNKSLSLAATLILAAGAAFIFADQYESLLTLLGLAVAGLAIALQEIVASFAAWFFIRSSHGFSTGNWIQIGDQFGEVVNIGFLRTTIQQSEPLTDDHRPHGANLTGGLTVIMNNQVFKSALVNYSRGYPFVWCSLTYTITFESDWEVARDMMLEAMTCEPEIVSTSKQAANYIREMASEYSIRTDSTQPVVRVWVGSPGVELTLRFLAHPRRRPLLMDTVNANVMRAVQKSDAIDYAYWTVRSIATPPPEPVSQNTQTRIASLEDLPDLHQLIGQEVDRRLKAAG